VVYASTGGAVLAFAANSLLMSMVFLIFSSIKKHVNRPWAIWLLIPVWIAWEHVHTLWDLAWTWLTLGNVFAFKSDWVQWFEFTGTSGGTAWILMTNIFIFTLVKNRKFASALLRSSLKAAAFIVIPMLLSFLMIILYTFKTINQKQPEVKPVKVVVVQPNIDPYNVKFSLDYQSQFLKVLRLLQDKLSEETDYLVLPETFITDNIDEAMLAESEAIRWFRDSLIKKYPRLRIVTGGNTYVFYETKEQYTATARKEEDSGKYYDVFNSAIYIDKDHADVYHKSKLVPGVERMPFPALLKPLEALAINMGGTVGSLGLQEKRTVFKDPQNHLAIAPVICYESVYADYVTGYMRNGANLIFIVTNDGWWKDTPGYIQHLNYARLRAIENRRPIARSANTGTSCFIDEFGRISENTKWWEEAVIEKDLRPGYRLTFFARFGDLISYASVTLSILLILWALFLRFKTRTKELGKKP
jgi:apolipoprotein N-acyltransferase